MGETSRNPKAEPSNRSVAEKQKWSSFGQRFQLKKLINYFVLTLAAFALAYYLLSQVKVADIASAIAKIRLPLFLFCIALSIGGYYLRAYRYKVLLGKHSVGINDLVLVTVARDLFTDVIPARLGSLSYIYILAAKYKVPVEDCISTFVVSAVLDSIAIMPMLVLALIIVGSSALSIFPSAYIVVSAVGFVVFLLVLVFLDKLVGLLVGLSRFVLRKLRVSGRRPVQMLIDKLVATNDSIIEIKKRGIYPNVFSVTVVIRFLKFVVYYLLLLSITLSMGYGPGEISFWKSFLGTASAELSASLPTHSVAGIGTYEASWTAAFVILGFPKDFAIVSGFSFHFVKLIYNVAFGLIAVLLLISLRRRVLVGESRP